MKVLLKIFNRYLWILLSVFFVIAFVVLIVGESFARENENNLNYALGINPWQMQTSETTEDTEYVKSNYVKKDADGNILYQTDESGVRSQVYDNEAMREASMEISRKAAADGAVLLWNNDDALPLAENSALSFFGVSSRANNWGYTGMGSGNVSVTKTDFMDLKEQFESEGKYTVNPTLYDSYPVAQQWKQVLNPYGDDNHYREFMINEKAWSSVNAAAGQTFAAYGDAAVYFISRTGSEDGDTWFDTSVYPENNDNNVDNNYLDLAENEIDTIEALISLRDAGTFEKVILVLNTGTPMQMKTISTYDIDACLWVGMGGNASFGAVYDVLSGKVNPSGRLADTYAYNGDSAPSTVNTGAFEFTRSSAGLPAENRGSNSYNHAYIVYQEGIYVGYRYYETRYEDSVLGGRNADGAAGQVNGKDGSWDYNEEVLFPFGYGLSYTDFEFSDFAVTENGDDYTVSVSVKNTGGKAGSVPVQIYLQKPYTDYDEENGIEKAAAELVGFAKTDVLAPDEKKTYTVDVDGSEFKTYDSYNKKTYILEKGDYYLAFGENAHDAVNNILAAKGYDSADGMTDIYGQPDNGDKTFAHKITVSENDYEKYSVSEYTQEEVTNRFDDTDINLYAGTANQKITYLSRKDWNGTYPSSEVKMTAVNNIFVKDMQYSSGIENWKDPDAEMPTYGTVTNEQAGKDGLKLIMFRGLEYDNPNWDDLLDQLTWEETVKLCGISNHLIQAVKSVSSPSVVAHDGPAGVKDVQEKVGTLMAFPCGVLLASTFDEALVEEVCVAFGHEMLHGGCGEIYGTGAGLHRSVYGGRNWEYFSEDGYLSGRTLCAEVKGLQSMGAIVNIKHLVLNDQEIYRCGITTWANEQTIRELYLKAFEAAVTEAKANGVMSSLNRLGCTWVGRHKGLLTDLLRGEWGFEGFVETDSATGLYMRLGECRAEAVIAGNDLWLRGADDDSELWGDFKNDPTVAQALRESAHRILYVVANSAAMNGIDSSTKFVYVEPWYFGAIFAGQTVTGVLMGVSLAGMIAAFVLYFIVKARAEKRCAPAEDRVTDRENDARSAGGSDGGTTGGGSSDNGSAEMSPGGEPPENGGRSRFAEWLAKHRKLLIVVGTAIVAAIVIVAVVVPIATCGGTSEPGPGPGPEPPPSVETHECEHKCPICGGCLDADCTDEACAVKCGDSYLYGETFNAAEELNVAKTSLTYDKTKAYYVGFSKSNEGAVSYKLNADKDMTVNLTASVYKNTAEDVFTDVITTSVNGVELDRPSVIYPGSDVANINLGCIELVSGENTINFVAEGDGEHVHEFLGISVAYDGADTVVSLLPAEQVPHTCDSECEVCGGCTDFSCLNPGCEYKCDCDSGTHNAHIFTVLDERADNHGRGINAEIDGVGCSWDKETRITYEIDSSIEGTVRLGVVVSHDVKTDLKFTDQFVLTVNGTRVHGDGTMPVSETGLREWNDYAMTIVGDITLKKGRNVIDFSQTPKKNVTNAAYNFQSMIIFSESGEFGWYAPEAGEHNLQHVPAVAATCVGTGNIEYWRCDDCGKYFSDEYGETEITDTSSVIVPVDPDNHTGSETVADDGVTVTCSDCNALLRYNFNGMDERCIFEGAEKNTDEQLLPGKNNVMTTITYYIVSDKDTTATMLVNCSAIATKWEVEFYKTWGVEITPSGETNPVSYQSETIHHYENQGKPDDVDRFHWFMYEEVATVTLKAGVNKVRLIGTGKEQLNFRDLAFGNVADGAKLSWGTEPAPEVGDEHELVHVPAVAATCTETGNIEYWYCDDCDKYYSDENGTDEISDTDIALPVDPDNHGGEEVTASDGVTVTCSACNTLIRYNFNGMDERCIFEGAEKDTDEQLLPGKNGTVTTITYYIVSDKDTTATMLVNCSAISTKWEVEFYKTWGIEITPAGETDPVSYQSETIHHYENQGKPDDVDRFHWFVYEEVATVTLKAGVNKVQLIGTGNEQLNFRDLAFGNVADGAKLSWGTGSEATGPDAGSGAEDTVLQDKEQPK